jgi:hypothetical protein
MYIENYSSRSRIYTLGLRKNSELTDEEFGDT